GMAVDMLFDPLTYVGMFGGVKNIGLATSIAGGVDMRARNLKTLDEVRKGSLDYYATIRSLYRQRRNDDINNGKTPEGGVGPGSGTQRRPNPCAGKRVASLGAPAGADPAGAAQSDLCEEFTGVHHKGPRRASPGGTRTMTAMRVIRTVFFAFAIAFA